MAGAGLGVEAHGVGVGVQADQSSFPEATQRGGAWQLGGPRGAHHKASVFQLPPLPHPTPVDAHPVLAATHWTPERSHLGPCSLPRAAVCVSRTHVRAHTDHL